jgi:hypothetical protein
MRNTILISSHIYLKVMSGITDREIDYVNLLPPFPSRDSGIPAKRKESCIGLF